mmetsp:Transcript_18681/g.58016  ORF Transcript_18681/g.58016 Transcript_18681/m.58016 type:complete len:293 (-) Transcript_18681:248-1126(-)
MYQCLVDAAAEVADGGLVCRQHHRFLKVRHHALWLGVDSLQLKLGPDALEQPVQIPLLLCADRAAVLHLVHKLKFLTRDLVYLIQHVQYGDIHHAAPFALRALDDVHQVVRRDLLFEVDVGVVDLILVENRLHSINGNGTARAAVIKVDASLPKEEREEGNMRHLISTRVEGETAHLPGARSAPLEKKRGSIAQASYTPGDVKEAQRGPVVKPTFSFFLNTMLGGFLLSLMPKPSSSFSITALCVMGFITSSTIRIRLQVLAVAITCRPRPLPSFAPSMIPGRSSNWIFAPM